MSTGGLNVSIVSHTNDQLEWKEQKLEDEIKANVRVNCRENFNE